MRGDGRFGGERFIEAHDKFGDVVQPRELGMIDDEAEELTGRNMSVDALVLAAFLVMVAAGWTFLTLSWAYSEGERAGVLQKFSKKG